MPSSPSAPSVIRPLGYDPVGNRQTQTTAGSAGSVVTPGVVNYGYDTRDRLLTENATSYGYDANGNLTTQSGFGTFTFDTENRLIRIAKFDGTLIEHAYDTDGVRIRMKTTPPASPTQTTNFLVDTSGGLSHVVAESAATGIQTAYYLRALDDLLAVIRPTGTRHYHADGIGSIRKLTDETGAVTDSYEYTAFGEQYDHVGTDPQPYSFAGEPLDPNTAFQYHRARWMQPRMGRFVGMDSWEGDLFDPASLHRFLYSGSDPLTMSDPTGQYEGLAGLSVANSVQSTLAGIQSSVGFAVVEQVLYGGNAGLENLAVGAAVTVGVGAVIYGVSKLGLRLLNSAGFRRFLARFSRSPVRPSIGRYADVVGSVPGLQANHLNQNGAFKTIIPRNEGAAVAMRGNAITDIGSPHYEFHASLELWWAPFRRNGARFGQRPTCIEYDVALKQALQQAGFADDVVDALAEFAAANRRSFGLGDGSPVPRIPGPLPQVRR